MAIAGCIVTAYLLNKCNLITTVSIIHTFLMCGHLRILKPVWKVHSNKFQCQYVMCSCRLSVNCYLSLRRMSSGEIFLRFLQKELPQLLENMPSNEWGVVYFQNDTAPPQSAFEIIYFLNGLVTGRFTEMHLMVTESHLIFSACNFIFIIRR